MKFLTRLLLMTMLLCGVASSANALTVLGTSPHHADFGYGNSSWDSMTSALDTATSDNFDLVSAFDDLALMLTYDALWLDARQYNNASSYPVLTTTEYNNIVSFISTGRRVVMMGENWLWTAWNQQIIGMVGGTYTGNYLYGVTDSIVTNELTNGVSTVEVGVSGVVATGGTALFDVNFATLWGDNVLTVLDINVFSDSLWGNEDNEAFAINVANWIADSGTSPVPEPSTILLFGLGLLGLAGVSRKKQ